MRSLIVAATAASLLTTAAQAETKVTASAGNWRAWTGKSNESKTPMCGLGIFMSDRSFMIKWLNDGDNKIFLHVIKLSWKIPAETEVPIELKYDEDDFTYGGTAWANGDNGFAINFQDDFVGKFMREFRAAAHLYLSFPSGNEKPWALDMTGSRAIADVFAGCIQKLAGTAPTNRRQATQPFGKVQPTAPTQPHGNGKAPLPSRPGERGA
jgi:hypothetical protein